MRVNPSPTREKNVQLSEGLQDASSVAAAAGPAAAAGGDAAAPRRRSVFDAKLEQRTARVQRLASRVNVKAVRLRAARGMLLFSHVAAVLVGLIHDRHLTVDSGDGSATMLLLKTALLGVTFGEAYWTFSFYHWTWIDRQKRGVVAVTGAGPLAIGGKKRTGWLILELALLLARPFWYGLGREGVVIGNMGMDLHYHWDTLLAAATITVIPRHLPRWVHEEMYVHHAEVVMKLYNVRFTYEFSFRMLLAAAPFASMFMGGAYLIVVLGYLTHIVEEPMSEGGEYEYMWNSMWLIMTTLSTVGYGDKYPQTHLGRWFCVVAFVLGNFIIATLFGVMASLTEFSPTQANVVEMVSTAQNRAGYRAEARRSVQCALRCNLYRVRLRRLEAEGRAGTGPYREVQAIVQNQYKGLYRHLEAAKSARELIANQALGFESPSNMLYKIYAAVLNTEGVRSRDGEFTAPFLGMPSRARSRGPPSSGGPPSSRGAAPPAVGATAGPGPALGSPEDGQQALVAAVAGLTEAVGAMRAQLGRVEARTRAIEAALAADPRSPHWTSYTTAGRFPPSPQLPPPARSFPPTELEDLRLSGLSQSKGSQRAAQLERLKSLPTQQQAQGKSSRHLMATMDELQMLWSSGAISAEELAAMKRELLLRQSY